MFLSNPPEDTLKCEHWCDTVVYECLKDCNHGTECMRTCWISHDQCSSGCPCNDECKEGCPDPRPGHPCSSWFCQGQIIEEEKTCIVNKEDRQACDAYDENACKSRDCCWTPAGENSSTPWCHYPKITLVPRT